jgi:acetoin utilization deacetylase AcuC-like enzyme
MDVAWIHDRWFAAHDTGTSHIERPARLEVIVAELESSGLLGRLTAIPFRAATAEQLALVHEPAYVDLVRLACDEGFPFIGSPETHICPLSYDVAALAAGGVLAACDAVMSGKVTRAFCAVRPPGHHAETDQAMGFCLFNNVALGAEHLVRHHNLSRIAIVDFDVHHGNGTQHIFEARRDVLYVSVHERPESLAFPGTGTAEENGRDGGTGYTLNVPLDRGSGEVQYRSALNKCVLPALEAYRPEFLLISAGFDALMWDNTSHLSLEADAYGGITRALVRSADRYAAGRVVSVLEGGYDLSHLGRAVAEHVRALLEDKPLPACQAGGSV